MQLLSIALCTKIVLLRVFPIWDLIKNKGEALSAIDQIIQTFQNVL